MELLVVITIIGILIALLLPAVQAAREAARRMQCSNNFRQVAMALHSYDAAKGCFPVGIFEPRLPGKSTAPGWWCWGTYILPFIEQGNVYNMIDFRMPNYFYTATPTPADTTITAAATKIQTYLCPSDPQSQDKGVAVGMVGGQWTAQVAMTDIAAVGDTTAVNSGSGGVSIAFPTVNGVFGANEPCRIADIKDGTSNTLAIGEVTGKGVGTCVGSFWVSHALYSTRYGINGIYTAVGGIYGGTSGYMYDTGFASWHPGGANFGMADGSAQFLAENIANDVLIALTTRDGGETKFAP